MAQPYIGEIRLFAGNFAPSGWMFCDGTPLAISEFDTLFNLIGTTYGGDGQSSFNLPDMRGRVPLHMGSRNGTTYQLAEAAGAESVTLTVNQMPVHSHPLIASLDPGSLPGAANSVLGALSPVSIYRPSAVAPSNAMSAQAISGDGGSQPHDNMQPYLCINFIISLFGLYPSPT